MFAFLVTGFAANEMYLSPVLDSFLHFPILGVVGIIQIERKKNIILEQSTPPSECPSDILPKPDRSKRRLNHLYGDKLDPTKILNLSNGASEQMNRFSLW